MPTLNLTPLMISCMLLIGCGEEKALPVDTSPDVEQEQSAKVQLSQPLTVLKQREARLQSLLAQLQMLDKKAYLAHQQQYQVLIKQQSAMQLDLPQGLKSVDDLQQSQQTVWTELANTFLNRLAQKQAALLAERQQFQQLYQLQRPPKDIEQLDSLLQQYFDALQTQLLAHDMLQTAVDVSLIKHNISAFQLASVQYSESLSRHTKQAEAALASAQTAVKQRRLISALALPAANTEASTEAVNEVTTQADKVELMAKQAYVNAEFEQALHHYQQLSQALQLAYQQALINIAMPETIFVPGGEFIQGDESGSGHDDERPAVARQVDSFYVAKYEVTERQYWAYLTLTQQAVNDDWRLSLLPVSSISYNQAKQFTDWLSSRSAAHYRLPMEHEWEFIAKRAQGSAIHQIAHCEGCSHWGNTGSLPVGSLTADQLGLFDIFGNLWEWVEDCYQPYTSTDLPMSAANDDSNCQTRVVRGGSWGDMPKTLRASNRSPFDADKSSAKIGFRLVRETS
ncbi:MAG: SUMF1/EgtB/PvdO family nonheme iron enzyme [Pseudomonadales bacterium]|nr:SUMF1/EgtB/PvdO family nonheme iron enzyme [Pseudomonadales bacterium]